MVGFRIWQQVDTFDHDITPLTIHRKPVGKSADLWCIDCEFSFRCSQDLSFVLAFSKQFPSLSIIVRGLKKDYPPASWPPITLGYQFSLHAFCLSQSQWAHWVLAPDIIICHYKLHTPLVPVDIYCITSEIVYLLGAFAWSVFLRLKWISVAKSDKIFMCHSKKHLSLLVAACDRNHANRISRLKVGAKRLDNYVGIIMNHERTSHQTCTASIISIYARVILWNWHSQGTLWTFAFKMEVSWWPFLYLEKALVMGWVLIDSQCSI